MPDRLDPRLRCARRLLAVVTGSEHDLLATGPALEVLCEQLPSMTLLLAAPAGAKRGAAFLPVSSVATLPDAPTDAQRVFEQARADAAIIFTREGESPHELAYALYLAGVPVRAGASVEFGGRALDPWFAPAKPGTPPAERHLYLLARAGFDIPDVAVDADAAHPAMRT